MKRALSGLLGLAALCAASIAQAQALGGGAAQIGPSIWRVVGAMSICVLAAFAAALFLRARLRPGAPSASKGLLAQIMSAAPAGGKATERLEVVQTVRLSHQIDISLLRHDDSELIVAATPQGLVVIQGPGATAGGAKP